MGDIHVHLEHVETHKILLEREPREFPMLEFKRQNGEIIDDWQLEDFEVKSYDPHKTIAMKNV
jgi:thymidylate synthase